MNLPSEKKFTDPRKRKHQHEIITLSMSPPLVILGLWDSGMTDILEDLRSELTDCDMMLP